MPLYSLDGIAPTFDDREGNWLAPDATIVGRVHIGADVGIWFGAVIRGDNEPIRIGVRSNIQEHTVMHTDPGFPLTVGAGCTLRLNYDTRSRLDNGHGRYRSVFREELRHSKFSTNDSAYHIFDNC